MSYTQTSYHFRKKRMTMKQFILTNRADVDAHIDTVIYRHNGRIPDPPPSRSDAERREWIRSDEELFRWARAEGVRL